MTEILKTPAEWAAERGSRIMDPDGWRMKDAPPLDEPTTYADFSWRFAISTVGPLNWGREKTPAPAPTPGLQALPLSDAISDAWLMRPEDMDDDEPCHVVAVAPCATFAVDAAELDGDRVVLRLREIREEA